MAATYLSGPLARRTTVPDLQTMQLGYSELPEALPEDAASNTDFLQKLYHALMNVRTRERTNERT